MGDKVYRLLYHPFGELALWNGSFHKATKTGPGTQIKRYQLPLENSQCEFQNIVRFFSKYLILKKLVLKRGSQLPLDVQSSRLDLVFQQFRKRHFSKNWHHEASPRSNHKGLYLQLTHFSCRTHTHSEGAWHA